jgi:tetratricopeptide (TPR) repeat protein
MPPRPPSVNRSFIGGHNIQIGSAGGNVVIYVSSPEYRLEWLLPTERDEWVPVRWSAPSHLLDASRAIVPFHSRPEVEDILNEWCADSVPISILLIHGPGGEGKTRLVNHLAGGTYTSGWAVAQAIANSRDEAPPAAVTCPPDPRFAQGDVLVAIDYADRWPADTLGKVIRQLPHRFPDRRIRALLLARSKRDLWPALRAHLHRFPADLADPVRLGDLYEKVDERAQFFATAAAAFQGALDLPPEFIDPPDLGHPDYGRALTLQMHALAAVCAHRDNTAGEPTREELSAYLLEHEIAYWHTHKSIDITPAQIAAIVFYATSFGPILDSPAAHGLLRAAHLASSDVDARTLLDAHERLYPPAVFRAESASPLDSHKGRYLLAPLRPDRLGEDYVAQYLTDHAGDRDRLIELLTEESTLTSIEPLARNRCLTILANASDRHLGACETLWPILRSCPSCVNSSCIYAVIKHAPRDLADLINRTLSSSSATELRRASRDLARHLVHTLPPETPPDQRASLLYSYGIRSQRVRDKHASIKAGKEAVRIYQGLARFAPRLYEPKLAASLAALGVSLAAEDKEAALARTQEADKLYRKLNSVKPSGYLAQQAGNLNSLSIRLRQVGDYEGAISASEENVQIMKDLMRSADNPRAYRSELARSLHNLSRALAAVLDADAAVINSKEAVRLYRELDHEEPESYRSQLAASLHNLSVALMWTDDKPGALDAINEAVRLKQELARADPDNYRGELARSLEVAAGVRQASGIELEPPDIHG